MDQQQPQLPELPKIEGNYNILLDVYTHESVRPPSEEKSDEYGDVERLEKLGRLAVQMAATYHLFAYSNQDVPSHNIPDRCAEALDSNRIIRWMEIYGMKSKIRCTPATLLDEPEILTKVFFAYAGALYIRNGQEVIQRWISGLIDPNRAPPYTPQEENMNPAPPMSPPPPSPPSQPFQSPPPVIPAPMFSPMQMQPLGAQPGNNFDQLITLQVFNQTAQQKGYTVTYSATSVGPPHNPTWTVTCFLNGTQAGSAQARNQKQAKEQAARMAFKVMNWP